MHRRTFVKLVAVAALVPAIPPAFKRVTEVEYREAVSQGPYDYGYIRSYLSFRVDGVGYHMGNLFDQNVYSADKRRQFMDQQFKAVVGRLLKKGVTG